MLNVHENTLRRWCDSGIIRSFRIGSRGDRRITEESVMSLAFQIHENSGYHDRS